MANFVYSPRQIETCGGESSPMREVISRPSDDIPLSEFLRMIGAVIGLILILLLGEIIFRWFIEPANTLLPLQLVEAWLWSAISNLIWQGSTEVVAHSTGPMTQVNLFHTDFVDGYIPLYVSDECAGLHEFLFLSMMVLLTPAFDLRTKFRHLSYAAVILFLLNMVRLIVLYPLAVNGCQGTGGSVVGCDAILFQFHDFVLRYGSLIVLVIGWTIWFNLTGARSEVRQFWKRLSSLQGIHADMQLETLREDAPRVAVLSGLVFIGFWGSWIMVTGGDASAVEACEGIISATCVRVVTEHQDAVGRGLRLFLLSASLTMFVISRPRFSWAKGEEE